jgi:hypothetical protein
MGVGFFSKDDMTTLGFMARDQYGQTIHLPNTKHPRKALLNNLGVKNAAKMYVDVKSGGVKHIGYIAQGRWFTLYRVCEWAK